MSRTLKLNIKETAEELKNLLKKENSAQVKKNPRSLLTSVRKSYNFRGVV
jgi:hypothetical protein